MMLRYDQPFADILVLHPENLAHRIAHLKELRHVCSSLFLRPHSPGPAMVASVCSDSQISDLVCGDAQKRTRIRLRGSICIPMRDFMALAWEYVP